VIVGRDNTFRGNVISANAVDGINIDGLNVADGRASGNVVQENLIGVGFDGVTPLGNGRYGVRLWRGASGNTIGTDGDGVGDEAEGNRIAHNARDGVLVLDAASIGNTIRRNSIHSNGGLGIDLGGDDVTANDKLDPDVGAGGLQNFPELTSVKLGAETKVTGKLKSTPSSVYVIDFYANTEGDPQGHGEGRRWIGSTGVTSNDEGTASFNVILSGATNTGEVITATATDVTGNTSEFSEVKGTRRIRPGNDNNGNGNGNGNGNKSKASENLAGLNQASSSPKMSLSSTTFIERPTNPDEARLAFDRRGETIAAIMAEWTSVQSFEDRISNLRGDTTGSQFANRANGNAFLTTDGESPTAEDDTDRDRLHGSLGRDWYFANLGDDQLQGRRSSDMLTDLGDA
jgi:hypothetical protein